MPNILIVETRPDFSFVHTIRSHGWSDLLPFELDEENQRLSYVFTDGISLKPVSAVISGDGGKLKIETSGGDIDNGKLLRDVRHILRLDDNMDEFYGVIRNDTSLDWVSTSNAGRLLRSPNVFEDLVKTLCTTNCSWGATKKMVANLVDKLGEPASDGKRAFPTPEALAKMPVEFFRDEIRAGYRSAYFAEMAGSIASGDLEPEAWLHSEMPSVELRKEIKRIKGFGDYAADNLLKLLGRYDGLALDSWLRAGFYKKHNKEK
ncbi:MAG: Fe-S cluster assembly protein HesB, partial [Saprospiraceae bacterium]|nr:Fe-S cluster assembly protein HesB [Pyrinomonadaceae bacterium]